MLKLWRILNSIGNVIYFIGAIFGIIFLCLVLTVFLPPIISVTFGILVGIGVILGIQGNVQNDRKRKRDAVDKELQDIASGRSPDTHPNG